MVPVISTRTQNNEEACRNVTFWTKCSNSKFGFVEQEESVREVSERFGSSETWKSGCRSLKHFELWSATSILSSICENPHKTAISEEASRSQMGGLFLTECLSVVRARDVPNLPELFLCLLTTCTAGVAVFPFKETKNRIWTFSPKCYISTCWEYALKWPGP